MAKTLRENPYLSELAQLSRHPSDINEHLLTLFYYATLCSSIVEFGVRNGVSTVAFFAGLYQRVMINPWTAGAKYAGLDISPACQKVIDNLKARDETDVIMAGFYQADTKEKSVVDLYWPKHPCPDLLFIDTLHNADQCYLELVHNSDLVAKYIILHDTVTFGDRGETPGKSGLNAAIKQWQMEKHDWRLARKCSNNNGLTVFERIRETNA